MSRLEMLIRELCSDGVEYNKLGEIATISRGGNFQKKDYVQHGVPCIHYGQIYTKYNLFVYETLNFIGQEKAEKQKYAVSNDIIMAVTSENIDDVCKCVAWLGKESVAISGHTAIIHHNQNPKFLAYYFSSVMFYKQKAKLAHGTKVIEVTPDKLKNTIIPVPPLEVQREIVRILDSFTSLTEELQKQLEAELQARKKQYEYYRDRLLDFGVHGGKSKLYTRTAKVREICRIARGKVISKAHINENQGIYPVYSSQTENNGELGRISRYMYDGEYLTWTTDGANAGTIFYRSGKFNITNVCGILDVDESIVITKYLFYVLTIEAPKHVSAGMGNPKLMSNVMGEIKVRIPPLDTQRCIVSILDRFDTLCNDLTSGLPAEIEARQKQYEYYRDKLLTFKEKA